jgi:hypothetical protein
MEMQNWVVFTLLARYKMIRTAVNNITYETLRVFVGLSVYIIVLVIRRSKRMRQFISSSVGCKTVPIFRHYLINATIFGGKIY